MKAVVFDEFGGPIRVASVAEPAPPDDGVVIEVRAAGICRSDWHGWQGHDPDIVRLPHVPGHEFAGVVAEVGRSVERWRPGTHVTMPFVAGCGQCPECRRGAAQVCDRQFQPGFSGWGAFAERVAVRYADFNLVALPEELDFVTAASLGCRLATAYRAVALQGRVRAGEWVAVFGCGGVGLSAVMVAAAIGARPIAIDIRAEALELAKKLGARAVFQNAEGAGVVEAIHRIADRGVDMSIDALGSGATAAAALRSLRKGGRHVQVGLLAGDEFQPRLPMELVISRELEIIGSHGLAAADYPPLLAMIASGQLDLRRLIGRTIAIEDAPQALAAMNQFLRQGVTIIDRF